MGRHGPKISIDSLSPGILELFEIRSTIRMEGATGSYFVSQPLSEDTVLGLIEISALLESKLQDINGYGRVANSWQSF